MIRLEGVSCAIGAVHILHGVDMRVDQGALVAVVGANGAGKTTLLRVISGLQPVTAGDILLEDVSIRGVEPYKLARRGVVHVPQGRQIVPTLTVEDNLRLGADRIPGLSGDDIAAGLEREYARFPILRERRHTAGGSLSGGEQQMLAISRALMMRPKLLMLDEPSLGLAPRLVRTILGALADLSAAGVSIILVEQAAFAALQIASYGYVLQNGRIALSGPARELGQDHALIQSYLG